MKSHGVVSFVEHRSQSEVSTHRGDDQDFIQCDPCVPNLKGDVQGVEDDEHKPGRNQ